ncbi:uridylate kinase [Fusarium longipes]|uniref:Uridylate kinase n=1 Tax=Fusarium longipes TaxID=694270 RepID=A0A395SMW8_9HYPO|nr:uridylate kinase [Fusarium longipes]
MASRMSLTTRRLAVPTSRLAPRTWPCALQCSRPYSSKPPRPRRNDEVKFWPFLVVALAGTGGYVALVNRRNDHITIEA